MHAAPVTTNKTAASDKAARRFRCVLRRVGIIS